MKFKKGDIVFFKEKYIDTYLYAHEINVPYNVYGTYQKNKSDPTDVGILIENKSKKFFVDDEIMKLLISKNEWISLNREEKINSILK